MSGWDGVLVHRKNRDLFACDEEQEGSVGFLACRNFFALMCGWISLEGIITKQIFAYDLRGCFVGIKLTYFSTVNM